MEKPSLSHMMTALRDLLGGHEPFKAAVSAWRQAHPIPGSGGQWPPFMDGVEGVYKRHFPQHFPAKIPLRPSV